MKTITAAELKNRLVANEVVLIDVREPAEYQAECIAEACHIPLAQLCQEKLPSMSKPIVFHCRSGIRSATACEKILAQNANLEVYTLDGGIEAWKNAGFATTKLGHN